MKHYEIHSPVSLSPKLEPDIYKKKKETLTFLLIKLKKIH